MYSMLMSPQVWRHSGQINPHLFLFQTLAALSHERLRLRKQSPHTVGSHRNPGLFSGILR